MAEPPAGPNAILAAAARAYGRGWRDLSPDGPARALRGLGREAEAAIGRVWRELPEEERSWYRLGRDAHGHPGALLREVACRRRPCWEKAFRAVARYAAVAAVAAGKSAPPPRAPLMYLPAGPLEISALFRRLEGGV